MSAWDIEKAEYDSKSLDVSDEGTSPYDVHIGDNGTKLYVAIINADAICQYNLSTAWDISTASYVGEFDFAAVQYSVRGITFSDDGAYFYVVRYNADDILQYYMPAPTIQGVSSIQGISSITL